MIDPGAGTIEVPVVQRDLYIDPYARDAIVNPSVLRLICGETEEFTRISAFHGRSVVDVGGACVRGSGIFDEHGDYYGVFNVKGSDFSNPSAHPSAQEPNDLRIMGLQDSALFDRVVKVSRHLRGDAGVLCEWPIYHARPTKYPVTDRTDESIKTTTVNGFRRSIYEEVSNRPITMPAAAAIGVSLADIYPGVSYRAMLTNFRLADLAFAPAHQNLRDAIDALQQRIPSHFGAWSEIEKLNSEDDDDVEVYLKTILPKIMGENLARLHDAGTIFVYPRAGNWSLAGEIVDLDSVFGKSVYPQDSAASLDGRVTDVTRTIAGIDSLRQGGLTEDQHKSFLCEFIHSYFEYKVIEADYEETVVLEALLGTFGDNERSDRDGTESTIVDFGSEKYFVLIRNAVNIYLEEVTEIYKNGKDDDVQKTVTKFMNTLRERIEPELEPFIDEFLEANGIEQSKDTLKVFLTLYEGFMLFDKIKEMIKQHNAEII